MNLKISDLWSWKGLVERGVYLFWGFCLFAVKYNLDRVVAGSFFDQSWTLFDLDTLRFYLWQASFGDGQTPCKVVLFLLSLPFLWPEMMLTLRRLNSLGWSPWLLLLRFVPFLNFFFFVLLCIMPSRSEAGTFSRRFGNFIPKGKFASAAVGIAISVLLCLPAVLLGTVVLGDYGWALFVGLPFIMGFLSVLTYTFHAPRTMRSCLATAITAVGLAGSVLLLAAIEGVICLIMVAPVAVLLGVAGGAMGCLIQHTVWRQTNSARLFCAAFLAVPLAMGMEHAVPPPLPKLQVRSSVIVDAPPEKVWRNVVTFSELPAPTEAIFKLGVAYPVRAEIDGQGVGAIRRCNFSTGPFVEPIEVWDEPRLLKFSVTQNPAPMQEWTPYRDVHPPHLHGYLESCGGQFRLVPLPGNRTLLEGTTWYYHHLWPADYWQLWSDEIIHTIHLRVLNHVKQLSEAK